MPALRSCCATDRPSALQLHGDGEQPVAIDSLQWLALNRDGEAEAAAPGAVAKLAQEGSADLVHSSGGATACASHGELQILSRSGTLSPDGAHLHIAIAVSSGDVIGGHLGPGSLVRTTGELRISPWAQG